MAQGSAVASTVPGQEPDLEEIDEFEEEHGEDTAALRIAEIEARARRQGWRPIDEYSGPPGKWVDAETFLERGANFLPFVQKQLRDSNELVERMGGEMAALRTELADSRQVLQELRKFALNANQAGYERARREIEAEMRSAVAEGNLEGFDAAKEKMEALQEGRAAQEREEAPPPPPPPPPQPNAAVKVDPAIEQFVAENPWFNTDPQLNQVMQGYHVALKGSKPGLTLAQNLAEAKRRVMDDFPDKFGQEIEEDEVPPQPRRPASPLPPSQGARQRTRAKGFDAIPDAAEREEARRAYARMKRHDPELTVEDYLTILDNPRVDVLEMRALKKRKQ